MINEENGNDFEYMIKEIGLYSRLISKRNTTHDNLVDMSIEKITLWKIEPKKRICEIILYIISFGIIFILELFFPKLAIKLRCRPAFIDDAEYVQIINKRGKTNLLKLNIDNYGGKEIEMQNLELEVKEDNNNINNEIKEEEEIEEYEGESVFKKINKKEKDKKEYKIIYDIDYGRKRQLEENEKIDVETNRYLIQKKHLSCNKYFYYLNNKYQYEENECLFVPCTFYINRYTIDEIIKMKNGIPNNNIITKLSQKYGINKIKVKNQGILKSVLKEISTLSNIYILICIIIWIFMEYYISIIIVLIINIILIIISSKNKLDNIHSLGGEENKKSIVIREGKEIEIKSENIVPGDIVILKPLDDENEIYIPCDGVILEGFCTVNESDLTGENTLVLKKEINIPNNKNEYFDYLKYKNSFLGVLWSFLNPLLQIIVYAIIFSLILKNKQEHYAIFLCCGLIPWTFFSIAVNKSAFTMIENGNIIKKVYFPRIILPISVVCAALVNFLISCIIILLFVESFI